MRKQKQKVYRILGNDSYKEAHNITAQLKYQIIKEIDCSIFCSIDTIRNLGRMATLKSLYAPGIVFILKNCDKITKVAQSALEIIMKKSPSHVVYILCDGSYQMEGYIIENFEVE